MKRNYKLTIRYDGTRYFGWEHQPSTDMTIQGKVERVLSRMVGIPDEEEPVKVIGAGRTDAGVHAQAMIANVWLETEKFPEEIRDYLNEYLPDDIGVTDVRIASDRFHSRYNAVGKTYCYSLYIGESKPVFDRKYVTVLEEMPDVERMRAAAHLLTGVHDYKSFCGNPRMKKSTIRKVDRIEIIEEGDYIRMYFHGTGFLQHMVRILTGTLLEVGVGKRAPEEMPELLEAKERRLAGPTAPAQGLCLVEVEY